MTDVESIASEVEYRPPDVLDDVLSVVQPAKNIDQDELLRVLNWLIAQTVRCNFTAMHFNVRHLAPLPRVPLARGVGVGGAPI